MGATLDLSRKSLGILSVSVSLSVGWVSDLAPLIEAFNHGLEPVCSCLSHFGASLNPLQSTKSLGGGGCSDIWQEKALKFR